MQKVQNQGCHFRKVYFHSFFEQLPVRKTFFPLRGEATSGNRKKLLTFRKTLKAEFCPHDFSTFYFTPNLKFDLVI